MPSHIRTSDPLLSRILGRSESLLAADIEANRRTLCEAIRGKRLLVVGAAGSIGAAFVGQLAGFQPRALHCVDLNENTLVEVVRDLRSSSISLPDSLLTFSLDFGSTEFAAMVAAHGPYDGLLNFSAMKHVRAERDPFSLMRMIDTNVRSLRDALALMPRLGTAFSVSTDKSVRPANLMGATKNLMEKVLFSSAGPVATTARFANVAFSAGSLLEGFELRLAKGQPLALPGDVRRYFISHEEAGQLCLLAAFTGADREAFFPRMHPEADLMSFADIAELFLDYNGYRLLRCADEDEAKRRMGEPGIWPAVIGESDTTGEKSFEEFFRLDDRPDWTRYDEIGVTREASVDPRIVSDFLAAIATLRHQGRWDKSAIVDVIRTAVPELAHHERGRDLDQKM